SMTMLEGTWKYTYDGAGQLVHAVFTSNNPTTAPNQDLNYVYDASGNRTQTVSNGITTAYSTNSLNEYTAVGNTLNVYDRDGNLISSTTGGVTTLYMYDAQNRLLSVSTPTDSWTYKYDAL